MTHERPYKEAISVDEAIAALRQGANTQFDPDLVEFFIKGLRDLEVIAKVP
jgi:HD-GYP domain-containing protein (c-di-GMP phosphodiesterase class II)